MTNTTDMIWEIIIRVSAHAFPICDRREITVQRRCYARVWRFRILRVTRKSIKWTWAEPFEMNVKIEQELNFVVDNDSRLFLDAQEAKKVSERTVDR